MFPGIFVFGLVILVAYTFTKVGTTSPLADTTPARGNAGSVNPPSV